MIFMIKRLVKAKSFSKLSKTSIASFPVKRNPPIVVHLGNVGLSLPGEELCAKTKKFSSRFSKIKFVGIDKNRFVSTQKNWRQIAGDAIFGLKSLKNNSVSIIRSEMTLGYYTSAIKPAYEKEAGMPSYNYAKRVMDVAIKKLKSNGKLVIVADKSVVDNIIHFKEACGFSRVILEKVKNEKAVSFWTEKFMEVDKEPNFRPIYSLTFIK